MKNATIKQAVLVFLAARATAAGIARKDGKKFTNVLFDAAGEAQGDVSYEGWSIPVSEALGGVRDFAAETKQTAEALQARAEAEGKRLTELDILAEQYQRMGKRVAAEIEQLGKDIAEAVAKTPDLVDIITKRKAELEQDAKRIDAQTTRTTNARTLTKKLLGELQLAHTYAESDAASLIDMVTNAEKWLAVRN